MPGLVRVSQSTGNMHVESKELPLLGLKLLRHSSVQQAQHGNENASMRKFNVHRSQPIQVTMACLHSKPVQAGRSSHFRHLRAMLTDQLLIQLLPQWWGKRNQRDSWEVGKQK